MTPPANLGPEVLDPFLPQSFHSMRQLARLLALVFLPVVVRGAPTFDPPEQPVFKRDKAGHPDTRFMTRHQGYVAIAAKGGVDLLLMGDFLTDDFRGNNKNGVPAIYERAFGRYRPANFGQGGDYTQHVLWRLQNGELDGITPRVMMLMIGGTNGSNGEPGERIAEGVKAIIACVRQKSPGTKILLLSVLPWDANPGSRRDRHVAVNQHLPALDDGGKTVKYVDISRKFLAPDGTIPKDLMPDGAHLSDKGYQMWADAVEAPLRALMQSP